MLEKHKIHRHDILLYKEMCFMSTFHIFLWNEMARLRQETTKHFLFI
jgi:hypothetical protein